MESVNKWLHDWSRMEARKIINPLDWFAHTYRVATGRCPGTNRIIYSVPTSLLLQYVINKLHFWVYCRGNMLCPCTIITVIIYWWYTCAMEMLHRESYNNTTLLYIYRLRCDWFSFITVDINSFSITKPQCLFIRN